MTPRLGTPARTVLSLVLISLLAESAMVAAQQAGQQQEGGERIHVVKRGDTLWDLAGFYFTNPFLWPVIFNANRDVVEDPHWIYPDERLRIPTVEGGLPVVVRDSGQAAVTPTPPPTTTEPQPEQRGPSVPTARGPRSRFYTPPPPVNEERATSLIMTRQPPYAVPPAEYLSAPWLADPTTIGVRGRVFGLADPSTQSDKLPQYLHPYDRIQFGSLSGDPVQVGDSMMVVRIADPVGLWGNKILPVALVRIDSVHAEVVSAKILHQYSMARTGDHLIPLDPMPEFKRGEPTQVMDGPEGRLLAFIEEEPLYGSMDDGFVDIGADAGLVIGDELVAYMPQRQGPLTPVELPSEQAARLRVIKVKGTTATVRVIDAANTTLRPGLLVRVTRRMQ